MTKSQYRNRISAASVEKKSRIVLALDPAPSKVTDALVFARRMIQTLQDQVCAIKVNFHMILPLSGKELAEISRLAHSSGLQCIADIKLNDIDNTNEAVVEHLVGRMGFDAVIANPFIGGAAMKHLVGKANDLGGGVIALIYMSHPGAVEGFGLKIAGGQEIYKLFYERALKAGADGIVVGAGQLHILKEITASRSLPVYSPGIGAQGGDAELAARSGADYLIVGRSIIEASNPFAAARDLNKKISSAIRG